MTRLFSVFQSRRLQVVTAILVVQWFALLGFTREELTPQTPPLRLFPAEAGTWKLARETTIEKEALSILQPDDYLVREYYDRTSARAANLFIAYFRTQRTERMPHSPKNCLPGNGWVPSGYSTIPVQVEGAAEPVVINSYIVRKEDQRAVVLYWYQTWNRTVASEYAARMYLALDSIRYNRTDTGLIRIMIPVPEGEDTARYQSSAVSFVQAVYPRLAPWFPDR